MKQLNLDTTSLKGFVESALESIEVNPTNKLVNFDIEEMAKGLAAFSKFQLNGINKESGILLDSMSTPSLSLESGLLGDATNPAHWLNALERKLTKRKIRASAFDFSGI